jgi:drug/metabolite transporter (DMT)-like permease
MTFQSKGVFTWVLLFALGLIWGSSFILMKQGLQVFSPIQIACLRIFISSLALLPLVVYHINQIPWKRWWMFLLAGFLGNGIPAFMFPIAQTRLDSSLVGMLNSIMPLFTLFVGISFWGLKSTKKVLIGLGVGFLGVFLLLFHKMGNSEDLSYAGFVFIASACYALNTNFIKSYLSDLDPILLTSVSFLFLCLPSGAALYSTGILNMVEQPKFWSALGLISILAILGTAFAVVIFNYLVKVRNALFAASVTYIVPVFAILWGLFFNETMVLTQLLGMAFVLGGVYIVNKK